MINIPFQQSFKQPWVLVQARTGITYGHQCVGGACTYKQVEGFLVPLFIDDKESKTAWGYIEKWTCEEVTPPDDIGDWINKLQVWTEDDGPQNLTFLPDEHSDSGFGFDEAWVPVMTPWGPGAVIWQNSD